MIAPNAAAIRRGFQPGSDVGPENPYPGSDGTTTWKASAGSPWPGVGQGTDHVEELDDRSGPSVHEHQGQRIGVRRLDVHEVDPLSVDRS